MVYQIPKTKLKLKKIPLKINFNNSYKEQLINGK